MGIPYLSLSIPIIPYRNLVCHSEPAEESPRCLRVVCGLYSEEIFRLRYTPLKMTYKYNP